MNEEDIVVNEDELVATVSDHVAAFLGLTQQVLLIERNGGKEFNEALEREETTQHDLCEGVEYVYDPLRHSAALMLREVVRHAIGSMPAKE